MTSPDKVLGFLDITGPWDPTLMLVMGGAILVNLPATWLILKRQQPANAERFHLPRTTPDKPLVLGAALFGIGWGIAGICPGPAVTSLLSGSTDIILFFLAMIAGFRLHKTTSLFAR